MAGRIETLPPELITHDQTGFKFKYEAIILCMVAEKASDSVPITFIGL